VHARAEPFRCERCGECCRWPGNILLRSDDIASLARFLRIEERIFVDRYARLAANRGQLTLTEREDGACVFLEGPGCRVYEARPAQCRGFPLEWDVSGAGCPERGA